MSALWSPRPDDLRLVPGQVQVFVCATEAGLDAGARGRMEAVLSGEERARVARLRQAGHRAQALVARALLRVMLGRLLGVAAEGLVFGTNGHGKPYLVGAGGGPMTTDSLGSRLQFNLSHTAGRVLLAVCLDYQVGVDIEKVDSRLGYLELAQRFFAVGEHAEILGLPEEEKLAAFYRCWTRKEAYMKAIGQGIAAGLDTFVVPVRASATPIAVNSFMLHDLPMNDGYCATLAIGAEDAAIQLWSASDFSRE